MTVSLSREFVRLLYRLCFLRRGAVNRGQPFFRGENPWKGQFIINLDPLISRAVRRTTLPLRVFQEEEARRQTEVLYSHEAQ